jgi:hypothetical protein
MLLPQHLFDRTHARRGRLMVDDSRPFFHTMFGGRAADVVFEEEPIEETDAETIDIEEHVPKVIAMGASLRNSQEGYAQLDTTNDTTNDTHTREERKL